MRLRSGAVAGSRPGDPAAVAVARMAEAGSVLADIAESSSGPNVAVGTDQAGAAIAAAGTVGPGPDTAADSVLAAIRAGAVGRSDRGSFFPHGKVAVS